MRRPSTASATTWAATRPSASRCAARSRMAYPRRRADRDPRQAPVDARAVAAAARRWRATSPHFVSPTLEYNPAKAKALLDMFGFVDRDGDGYRENPDGSPLVDRPRLDAHAARAPAQRALEEVRWTTIGIRMTFDKVEKLPELRKQARVGKVQSFSYGWIADYPDGENFLQLFWTRLDRPGQLRDVRPARVQRALRAARKPPARRARARRALRRAW